MRMNCPWEHSFGVKEQVSFGRYILLASGTHHWTCTSVSWIGWMWSRSPKNPLIHTGWQSDTCPFPLKGTTVIPWTAHRGYNPWSWQLHPGTVTSQDKLQSPRSCSWQMRSELARSQRQSGGWRRPRWSAVFLWVIYVTLFIWAQDEHNYQITST